MPALIFFEQTKNICKAMTDQALKGIIFQLKIGSCDYKVVIDIILLQCMPHTQ